MTGRAKGRASYDCPMWTHGGTEPDSAFGQLAPPANVFAALRAAR